MSVSLKHGRNRSLLVVKANNTTPMIDILTTAYFNFIFFLQKQWR